MVGGAWWAVSGGWYIRSPPQPGCSDLAISGLAMGTIMYADVIHKV